MDSEPFSVIPRSPLGVLRLEFIEKTPPFRKHHGEIVWKPAFLRQGTKRGVPIRWRRN
jgi:hypothetical protein